MRGMLCAKFPIAERRKLDAAILPDKKRVEDKAGNKNRTLFFDKTFD